MGARPGCYVDTCLLVSLFLQDEGYATAEHWLAGSAGEALWVSHWVLLEFAAAVGLRVRRGDLEPRRPQVRTCSGREAGS
jgi:predicted nucleic acid-binding protein